MKTIIQKESYHHEHGEEAEEQEPTNEHEHTTEEHN